MSPHGTDYGYHQHLTGGTVPCNECRAAHAEAAAQWRAGKGEPPVHGTLYGYRVYGCRCGGCRRANTVHQRAYRAARKASKDKEG